MTERLTCKLPLNMTPTEKEILRRLQVEGGESMNGAVRRLIRGAHSRDAMLRQFRIRGLADDGALLLTHDGHCTMVLETSLPVDLATLLAAVELHTRHQCPGQEETR